MNEWMNKTWVSGHVDWIGKNKSEKQTKKAWLGLWLINVGKRKFVEFST